MEGPVTRHAVATYTFIRAAGAKGIASRPRSAREIVQQAFNDEANTHDKGLLEAALQQASDPYTEAIAEVALRTGDDGAPLPIPSAAFGVWG